MVEQPILSEPAFQLLTILERGQRSKSSLREELQRARERVVEEDKTIVSSPGAERELYSYIERWALNAGFGTVKIVGNNHRRSSWENPDIIALDCYDYEWLVGSEFEITSIEAKLAFDIIAIWQAAHYRRFSHFVYLACSMTRKVCGVHQTAN